MRRSGNRRPYRQEEDEHEGDVGQPGGADHRLEVGRVLGQQESRLGRGGHGPPSEGMRDVSSSFMTPPPEDGRSVVRRSASSSTPEPDYRLLRVSTDGQAVWP